VHGGNFVARSLRVKQHGAILGMQMRPGESCFWSLVIGGLF
jgi:hypothetical protein